VVDRAALPYLKLSLRPESLVFQGDEQTVSAGGIQIVDLLGGGETIPHSFDEQDVITVCPYPTLLCRDLDVSRKGSK
jgi:hypothetical protein